MSENLLDLAIKWKANGLSIIPADHRDKRPLFNALPGGGWKAFQSEPPTGAQIHQWFSQPRVKSAAVICGKVSGGLTVFDFDQDADRLFPDFMEAARDIIADALIVLTGGGNGRRQIYVRCNDGQKLPGNQPLAHIADAAADKGQAVAIETRGEGGYALLPGSLHPSGNYYEIESGSINAIPEVTRVELETLSRIGRSFEECPLNTSQIDAAVKQHG